METEETSTRGKVVQYLNDASFETQEKVKIEILAKVQELVVHFESNLLDSFYEEIVAFQTDRNGDVRKFVVSFIEEACKKDSAMLPRLVPNVEILLADETVAVVKRVIQAAAQLHKYCITWISTAKQIKFEMDETWQIMNRIKNTVISMIDHDNDGVRTQAIKFLESVILAQTYTEPDSIQRVSEITLDQVPLTIKILKPRKLEEEARTMLGKLIGYQNSLHISSVNLMTCMSSLSIIARARPTYMTKVIEAFEILHANLPPTLTKSQVNSVRKHLKIQLLNLLRHTASYDYQQNAIDILTDLGASASEVNKVIPNKDDIHRRIKRTRLAETPATESPRKKQCLEKVPKTTEGGKDLSADDSQKLTAVDITTKWVVDKLSIEHVTNLVMLTMLNLPDQMPALFLAAYSPVTGAGTPAQLQHVGRLIASQMTAAGIGPGAQKFQQDELKENTYNEGEDSDDESAPQKRLKISVVGVSTNKEMAKRSDLQPAGFSARINWSRLKTVKLDEITKPIKGESLNLIHVSLLRKLIRSGQTYRLYGTAQKAKLRIIARFCMFATIEEMLELEEYIFKDLMSNFDLLQSWLFSLHANSHDFSQLNAVLHKSSKINVAYDKLFYQIVTRITEMPANKERNETLSRLLLEAPTVPSAVLSLVAKCFGQGQETTKDATNIIKDIAYWRPANSTDAINLLIELSSSNEQHERETVRDAIIELYSKNRFAEGIIDLVKKHLFYLVEETPPVIMTGSVDSAEWTEDQIKNCLFLAFALLPHKQGLIHDLAVVYVKSVNDAKRTILRLLEDPVSHMGMDSPTLLSLVEECPKGSETLITRIIHVLTEKAPPSEELVHHVRELYNKRVSDVRFLIPVLTGLSKKEVVAVLPKLIKLNPHVVKEVFNRLWGVSLDKGNSPLSAVELLEALHLIPPEKCDMKTIIKATSLCFAERTIYNAETLAVVLQQLLEQPTLPTLFMRTVIQTLTHHPKLVAFIMNILQRLITKQIWKDRRSWEGFVKCCERATPHSFSVLRQLPPPQLAQVFIDAPNLQVKLTEHVDSLTEPQRDHIPPSILDVIRQPTSAHAGTAASIQAMEMQQELTAS